MLLRFNLLIELYLIKLRFANSVSAHTSSSGLYFLTIGFVLLSIFGRLFHTQRKIFL